MPNNPIDLLSPMFQSKSTDENNSQLINLYLNSDDYQGKDKVVAYPTPGTPSPFVTIASPVRSMYSENGITYAVGANKLYSISSAGIATQLATLNSSTGKCKIKGINEGLFILDVHNGYTYTFNTSTLTNLQSNSTVASIDITNGGAGYTGGANVAITDPTGSSATATATVVGSIVTSIAVNAAGTNYTNPVVVITPPGSGGAATANLNTSLTPIDYITLTNSGSNYINPTISFSDSTGSGAAATISLVASSGIIQYVTITNQHITAHGAHSISSLTVMDNGGPGSGATVSYSQQSHSGAHYDLTSLTLLTGGTNYRTPYIRFTFNDGFIYDDTSYSFTHCFLPANSGVLQSGTLTLTNPGSGYTNPTATVVDSYGSGGAATATKAVNTISSITVNAGGSGYGTTVPPVTITDAIGPGTGATATATLTGGAITAISVVTGGKNYATPVVTVTSSGSGATATANLTSSSFPPSVNDIECQDEFGIAITTNSQEISSSSVTDLTDWPALNIGSTTGQANTNVALVSFERQVYILGTTKSEIWWNAGTTPFTFERVSNTYLECGCVSASTVTISTKSIFFLGRSANGGIQVYQLVNYIPNIISQQINYIINTYSTIDDAYAFMYTQEGEEFYVLTFPTEGITWVYSLLTQQWHIRQSLISGHLAQWFPSCYTYNYNKHLVGDSQSGNIYQLSTSTYQENGQPITRTLVTHPYYSNGEAVSCSRLQIDFDQTPGATLSNINLYVSRDGGYTFGDAKPAIPVQTSDGEWRCYWTRLGRARSWVFKIETTLNNKVIILGAWGNFSGESKPTKGIQ